MTAVSGKYLGLGARRAWVFPLNASGSPNATVAANAVYEGLRLTGVQSFTPNFPGARPTTHVGDDIPLAIDYLPPTESASATMTIARLDLDIIAALTSQNVITLDEKQHIGLATSELGLEPQVALFTYQQALDETGARVWRWYLMPRAILYVAPQGFQDGAASHNVTIAPMVVTKHLWEVTMAAGVEGYTSTQMIMGISKYRPRIVAWLAAGASGDFLFPTVALAADFATPKVSVWNNGVKTAFGAGVDDGHFTMSDNTKIILGAAPTAADRIVAFYEQAD
jgi:hypothetical protein